MDIEEALDKKRKILKELKVIDGVIIKNISKISFDDWYELAPKKDYPYMVDKTKYPLIREYIESCERYQISYFQDILEWAEDWGEFSEEQLNKLKKELQEANLESVTYDW